MLQARAEERRSVGSDDTLALVLLRVLPRKRSLWVQFSKVEPCEPLRSESAAHERYRHAAFLSLPPPTAKDESDEFPTPAPVLDGIRSRLDLPFHGGGTDASGRQRGFLSCESTANTFRCTFCSIRLLDSAAHLWLEPRFGWRSVLLLGKARPGREIRRGWKKRCLGSGRWGRT